jgi:hypothetical protein
MHISAPTANEPLSRNVIVGNRLIAERQLSLADVIYRPGHHAGGFLGAMEFHRILGHDEIEEKLRLALKVARPRRTPTTE